MSRLHDLAKEYIEAGLVLVPIPKGSKGPTGKGWNLKDHCVTDAATLNGGNIGLAHAYSGTCALDIDDYQGANDWLSRNGINLQELLMADTAVQIVSGRPNKAKLLYSIPEPLPSVKILGDDNVVLFELRCAAANGLTVQDVLPPSIHPDTGKPYEWRGDWRHRPMVPSALLSLWRARLKPTIGSTAKIALGGRNDYLFRKGSSLRAKGLGEEAILDELIAENYKSCNPPLSPNEVRTITSSVMKYEAGALEEPRKSATLSQVHQWLSSKACISFDEFKNSMLYYGRAIKDSDVAMLRLHLESERPLKAGRELMFDAVELVASQNTFDSLKDYVNALRWDGIERLDTFLTDALGCVQDKYAAEIGKRFLVGAIERALNPGALHRVALILAGDENIGKSSFCRALCKEESWFTDNLPPDLHDKAASEAVLGRWIIESPEMASFKRSAQEAIKSFISRPVEKFRPAYGRCVIEYPRRCVLVGTTNNMEPLAEGEQNTRFWPIVARELNLDYVKTQRDQIWAEAKMLYEKGMLWWDFDASIQRYEFTDADEWAGIIEKSLVPTETYTIVDIALNAIGLPTSKVDLVVKHRIGRCLRGLGWKRAPRGTRGAPRQWVKESH